MASRTLVEVHADWLRKQYRSYTLDLAHYEKITGQKASFDVFQFNKTVLAFAKAVAYEVYNLPSTGSFFNLWDKLKTGVNRKNMSALFGEEALVKVEARMKEAERLEKTLLASLKEGVPNLDKIIDHNYGKVEPTKEELEVMVNNIIDLCFIFVESLK